MVPQRACVCRPLEVAMQNPPVQMQISHSALDRHSRAACEHHARSPSPDLSGDILLQPPLNGRSRHKASTTCQLLGQAPDKFVSLGMRPTECRENQRAIDYVLSFECRPMRGISINLCRMHGFCAIRSSMSCIWRGNAYVQRCRTASGGRGSQYMGPWLYQGNFKQKRVLLWLVYKSRQY